MEKLIKKLEAASGGSYYLDKEISKQREPGAICFPNYTRSIDAALTLVPEGWGIHLHNTPWMQQIPGHEDVFPCSASIGCGDGDGRAGKGAAPTLALAICIAALKA